MRATHPLYLAGEAVEPNLDLEVRDKYHGEVVTRVPLSSAADIKEAIMAAVEAAPAMAAMASYERRGVLEHCVQRFTERRAEFEECLVTEAGKTQADAGGEVDRLIDTFRVGAEEASRMGGEVIPLDVTPRARGYTGMWRRVPLGPCSFITPFNFPLNLVAHKVAPALAAGCPFILKPASLTPVGAILIGEVLAECDLPRGAFSILPCRRDGADLFTTDERLKLLSFTGSPVEGWDLKARAGRKKVVLELGGNAACVVDESADLEDAVARVVLGGYAYAGQSCISVQRVLVHESLMPEFRQKLVAAVRALRVGDPHDPATTMGPMISENEALRLETWVRSALDAGATLLLGGDRQGALFAPTILEDVGRREALWSEEAFGPVLCLRSFAAFEDALTEVNDSAFGLQAGVFTRDLHHARLAWERLEVGGVIVGDIPSWRVDHMPYGGVKASGFGREGLRFAMEDMSEMRMLVIRDPEA